VYGQEIEEDGIARLQANRRMSNAAGRIGL